MSKPCPKCSGHMNRQSTQCRECYEKQQAKPESYAARTCPMCGTDFTIHKSQVERGQGRYCSVRCARSGSPTRKRTRVNLKCGVCGEMFERHLSELRRPRKTQEVFCSRACRHSYQRGENHPNWEGGQHERLNPEGRTWRQAVIERDKGFCRLCRSQERLEAHHIKRFTTHPEKRWEIENGLTLCHKCHVRFRNREKEYEEELSIIASVPVMVWHA